MTTTKWERRKLVTRAIDELFSKPEVPADFVRDYLTQLHSNLIISEKLLSRNYAYMLLIFLAFLFLDTGLISKLTFQGAELKRTGIVLIMLPCIIVFLFYRSQALIEFVHELRTAISLVYYKVKSSFYTHHLDILIHYPSIRNLESFQGFVDEGSPSRKRINSVTTFLVAMIMGIVPMIAIIYPLYRSWHYDDLPKSVWFFVTLISLVICLRAFSFGGRLGMQDPFVDRNEFLSFIKDMTSDNEKKEEEQKKSV